MGAQIKKGQKQNGKLITGFACGAIIILAVVIALVYVNSQKKAEKTPNNQAINDSPSIAIPSDLVLFNKCRVLKMVDNYNEIKDDRAKREHFNIYNGIDDKTIPCLEERSHDVASFASRVSEAWEDRKNEYFINDIQTPEYFLKEFNKRCENNIDISENRDVELKNFALYYAYWGTLGNFSRDLNHFMTYKYAMDLIVEAGATYVSGGDSFMLSVTLPNSGQTITVTQDTDKDSAPTPTAVAKWGDNWWENR